MAAEEKLMQTSQLKDSLEKSLNEALERLEEEEHAAKNLGDQQKKGKAKIEELNGAVETANASILKLHLEERLAHTLYIAMLLLILYFGVKRGEGGGSGVGFIYYKNRTEPKPKNKPNQRNPTKTEPKSNPISKTVAPLVER